MENKEIEWLRRLQGKAVKPAKQSAKQKNTKKDDAQQPNAERAPQSSNVAKPKGNGMKDIAGMNDLKEKIQDEFIDVINHPDQAKRFGINPPSLLFYGPTGCGKTYFAEKMAEEIGINFMKVVPDDIANQFCHGTQQLINQVFTEAEKKAPTLLFFDEFDCMVPKRSHCEGNRHMNGEVNEFLCMLNNASERGIYVVAATNHPEFIDSAVLRSGRIDEMVYIDMPDEESRKSLFSLALSKLPVEDSIDTNTLATMTKGYNCSDISYIVKKAARKVFKNNIHDAEGKEHIITQQLLEEIISAQRPSITAKELQEYERVRNEFSPKDDAKKPVRIGFRQ